MASRKKPSSSSGRDEKQQTTSSEQTGHPKLAELCTELFVPGCRIGKKMGSGSFGTVWSLRQKTPAKLGNCIWTELDKHHEVRSLLHCKRDVSGKQASNQQQQQQNQIGEGPNAQWEQTPANGPPRATGTAEPTRAQNKSTTGSRSQLLGFYYGHADEMIIKISKVGGAVQAAPSPRQRPPRTCAGKKSGHRQTGTVPARVHVNQEQKPKKENKQSFTRATTTTTQPKKDVAGSEPGRLLDCFLRETFFLKALEPLGIAPKLFKFELVQSGAVGLQLMEKFSGNSVKHLGRRQAMDLLHEPSNSSCVAFTMDQLTQMLRLAQILDQCGIIHGDLKFSNLLAEKEKADDDDDDTDGDAGDIEDNLKKQKKQKRRKTPFTIRRMVIADFGFAGEASCLTPEDRVSESVFQNSKEPALQEVLAHYGRFSPLIGFMRAYGCPYKRRLIETVNQKEQTSHRWFCLEKKLPETLIRVFNRCQLFCSLVESRVYVLLQGSRRERFKSKRLEPLFLAQLLGLTKTELVSLKAFCPEMKSWEKLGGAAKKTSVETMARVAKKVSKAAKG